VIRHAQVDVLDALLGAPFCARWTRNFPSSRKMVNLEEPFD
jgi:hypothetical protein